MRALATTALAIGLWLGVGTLPGPSADARAVPLDHVAGVSLGLFASDPDYDYSAMLRELTERGATDVLVVVPLSQADVRSVGMSLAVGASPSPDTIERTLLEAGNLGLRVGVMPIVQLRSRENGEWRGVLVPELGASAWFHEYEEQLLPLADAAERHGASRFVIGSELNSLESYEGQWSALIQRVRTRFSGTLTYSANWDHYEEVSFWPLLDEIAISAYFPTASVAGARPTEREASDVWRAELRELNRFSASHALPLVLSEVGFPAHADAAAFPWDETREAPVDVHLQAGLLRAFCAAYSDAGVDGFYVWNWFGAGGPRDPGYSLRGKPAAAELSRCLRTTPPNQTTSRRPRR